MLSPPAINNLRVLTDRRMSLQTKIVYHYLPWILDVVTYRPIKVSAVAEALQISPASVRKAISALVSFRCIEQSETDSSCYRLYFNVNIDDEMPPAVGPSR